MDMHYLSARDVRDFADAIRSERELFAAKMRIARAVLGWNQTEFGARVGLTQRAVHKLEQGHTEPRRATVLAVEHVLAEAGLSFAEAADSVSVTIRRAAIHADRDTPARRRRGARLASAGQGAQHGGFA